MRVVVDTNVFVSGLISTRGATARVVDAVLDGRIVPVFSRETRNELEEVLGRPKLKLYLGRAGVDKESFLADLAAIAEIVRPGSVKARIRDPKDQPILAVASTDPPPDYVITGDRDFEEVKLDPVRIVSPSWFARNVLRVKT